MLIRFGLVGGLGFLVDAGILTLLVNALAWHHYTARAVSFAAAVSVTWALNRQFVFTRTANSGQEYARYFTVQVVGALLNLGTYVAVIQTWSSLGEIPVVPLGIGAALGLLFNFSAARVLVYSRSSTRPRPSAGNRPISSYSGRENLEAMKYARNYNRFLLDLVKQHAPDGISLDFGAGAGTFALPLSQAGKHVICVEPDDELRLALQTAGLTAFAGIEEVTPQSADYIYTLNVLEHIEDDAAMLAALCTRLKPGGVVLIYVPAFEVLFSAMDEQVGHFRRYRMESLKELVAGTGLVVTRAAYVDCMGFLAALLYRAIGSCGTINAASVRAYDRIAFPISRIADRVLSAVFGKNLLVVARKPR